MSKVTNIEHKEKEVAVRETPARAPRLVTPFQEMDQLVDRLFEGFGPRWMRAWRPEWPWGELDMRMDYRLPRVDVIDRDEEVVVRAELPGVEKEHLDVSIAQRSLTIRATTHREEKAEEGDYHRSEIVEGEFLRTLTLPADVDGGKAKATLKGGLLELKLPKLEVQKKQKITVE